MNSICYEIKKVTERLSAVDQRLLVVDQKLDAQNVKIQCLENKMPERESKVQQIDIRTSTHVRPFYFTDDALVPTPPPLHIPGPNNITTSLETLVATPEGALYSKDGATHPI